MATGFGGSGPNLSRLDATECREWEEVIGLKDFEAKAVYMHIVAIRNAECGIPEGWKFKTPKPEDCIQQ